MDEPSAAAAQEPEPAAPSQPWIQVRNLLPLEEMNLLRQVLAKAKIRTRDGGFAEYHHLCSDAVELFGNRRKGQSFERPTLSLASRRATRRGVLDDFEIEVGHLLATKPK
jgi:hypothetical protein